MGTSKQLITESGFDCIHLILSSFGYQG